MDFGGLEKGVLWSFISGELGGIGNIYSVWLVSTLDFHSSIFLDL